jgi:RecB family exonuclease
MKNENPIEEIWRIRDQMSAEEGYDIHRLFERLRREQDKYADRLVQPPPRGSGTRTSTALREEPQPYHSATGNESPACQKSDNPIEEVWRIRDQMSAEEGHDVHRLFERLRREEQKYADRLVQVPPRRTKRNDAEDGSP